MVMIFCRTFVQQNANLRVIGPTFPKIRSEKHYMDKKFPLAQNTLSHAKTIRKSELKCHRKSSQSKPCDYQRGTIIKVFFKNKD